MKRRLENLDETSHTSKRCKQNTSDIIKVKNVVNEQISLLQETNMKLSKQLDINSNKVRILSTHLNTLASTVATLVRDFNDRENRLYELQKTVMILSTKYDFKPNKLDIDYIFKN